MLNTQLAILFLIVKVEEEEPTGFVRYEKFEPVLCRILLERRYQPASEEQLLKAFKVTFAHVIWLVCMYIPQPSYMSCIHLLANYLILY